MSIPVRKNMEAVAAMQLRFGTRGFGTAAFDYMTALSLDPRKPKKRYVYNETRHQRLVCQSHEQLQRNCLALRHAALRKPDSPVYGLPVQVYIDNGRDYQSKHLAGGLKHAWKFDYSDETKGVFASLNIEPSYCTFIHLR